MQVEFFLLSKKPPLVRNLWGNELRGAVKLLLVFNPSASVFQDHSESSACLQSSSTHCFLPPRTSLPLSLLSLHSNVWTIPLSLCIYQLSLSPPFSIRAHILFHMVSIFSKQYFPHSLLSFLIPADEEKSHKMLLDVLAFVGCWGSSLVDIRTSWHKTMCDISSVRGQRSWQELVLVLLPQMKNLQLQLQNLHHFCLRTQWASQSLCIYVDYNNNNNIIIIYK